MAEKKGFCIKPFLQIKKFHSCVFDFRMSGQFPRVFKIWQSLKKFFRFCINFEEKTHRAKNAIRGWKVLENPHRPAILYHALHEVKKAAGILVDLLNVLGDHVYVKLMRLIKVSGI